MTAFTIVTPEEDVLGGVYVPVMNKASHPAQAPPGGKERKAGEPPHGQSLQALCCPYRKSTILLHQGRKRTMSDTTLFRTLVETPLSCHPIQPQDGCILLGSCFAQEMGNYMNAYEMDVLCNPQGHYTIPPASPC